MGLIKSANTPARLMPFSMRDVENHAKGILLRAQEQAEELLAAAQVEGEAMRQQARAEGYAEGRTEGLEQGLKQGRESGHTAAIEEHRTALTEAVNALNIAMATINAAKLAIETEALTDVVTLAAAIAARVTKRQAAVDPQVLISNLDEVMKLVGHASDLRVAIHPAQRATLDDAMPRLKLDWPALAHAAIVDDDTLDPGGCRVFTRNGRIDADIAGQLDRVINEVLPKGVGG
jgi:flagellar assembly protein FliH